MNVLKTTVKRIKLHPLDCALAAFFILLVYFFNWNTQSVDIWWHLKCAEYALENGSLPIHDPFSFTAAGEKWNQHSWLGGLIYYFPFIVWGEASIKTVTIAVKIATVILAYMLLLNASLSRGRALFYAVCTAIAIHSHTPRPHVFSPLLALLYFYALNGHHGFNIKFSVPKHNLIRVISLFVLSLLWINIHGEFVVGAMLTFSCFLGTVASNRRDIRAGIKVILLPSLLGFLCNPHGVGGLVYPLLARQYPSKDWNSFFDLNGINAIQPMQIILICVILILLTAQFLTTIRNRKNIKFTLHSLTTNEWIVSLLCIILFVLHVRMTWVLIFPIFFLLLSLPKKEHNFLYDFCFTAVLLVLFVFFFSFRTYIKPQLEPPLRSLNFAKEVGLKGNVLAPLIWGGHIIFNNSPDLKVFIDTRFQIYFDSVMNDYNQLFDSNCPNKIMADYDVDMILMPNGGSEFRRLVDNDRWISVFSSSKETLFLRKDNNESNWQSIVDFYKTNNISFSKENGFFLIEHLLENPQWVMKHCGLEKSIAKRLYEIMKYIQAPYDRFRPDSRRHRVNEKMAELLYDCGFYSEASFFIAVAHDLNPTCEKGRFIFANTLFQLGDYEHASVIYEELYQEYSNKQYEIMAKEAERKNQRHAFINKSTGLIKSAT